MMKVYIWILTLCVSVSCSCKRDSRCKMSRIRTMKAADCFNKDIYTFPQCLPDDVEIVDLSHNRIRKLTKTDLNKYSYLKMLYLNDNLIGTIDEETFADKDDLHTLDISFNGITNKLPTTIFHLPSLKSLYLGQNQNMNIVDIAEKAKPITSPLYTLDINNIMTEEANDFPDFGMMPLLEKYNISGNKLSSISTKIFAGLCSLKFLDTVNVSLTYDAATCDCWNVNKWLKERKVSFTPFICPDEEDSCNHAEPSQDDLKVFEECQEKAKTFKKSQTKLVLSIVIPVIVILSTIALIWYLLVRKRRKGRQEKKNDTIEDLMLNDTTFDTSKR